MDKSLDGKQLLSHDLPTEVQTLETGKSRDTNQTITPRKAETVMSSDRGDPNPTATAPSPSRKKESPQEEGQRQGGPNQKLANGQLSNTDQTFTFANKVKLSPTEIMTTPVSHNRENQTVEQSHQVLMDQRLPNRTSYCLQQQFTPISFRTRSSLKRQQNNDNVNITSVSKCRKLSYSVESDTSGTIEMCSSESENEDEIVVFVATSSDSSESAPTRTTESPQRQRMGRGRERKVAVASQKKAWRNGKGETCLHMACIKGHSEDVKRLLGEGADPNTKDNAGWTPLHEACNHGYKDIVEMLVDAGAVVNMPGFKNETPLHDSVANGHIDIVKFLLNRGASVLARNCNGLTPQDYADSPSVSSLLTDHGSNVTTPIAPNLPSPKVPMLEHSRKLS
jgi:BRCA1-associated RING domain protein 1